MRTDHCNACGGTGHYGPPRSDSGQTCDVLLYCQKCRGTGRMAAPQSPEDAPGPTSGGVEVFRYAPESVRALQGLVARMDEELTRRALSGEGGLMDLARLRGQVSRAIAAGRVDG